MLIEPEDEWACSGSTWPNYEHATQVSRHMFAKEAELEADLLSERHFFGKQINCHKTGEVTAERLAQHP